MQWMLLDKVGDILHNVSSHIVKTTITILSCSLDAQLLKSVFFCRDTRVFRRFGVSGQTVSALYLFVGAADAPHLLSGSNDQTLIVFVCWQQTHTRYIPQLILTHAHTLTHTHTHAHTHTHTHTHTYTLSLTHTHNHTHSRTHARTHTHTHTHTLSLSSLEVILSVSFAVKGSLHTKETDDC